ncbi:MAG: hypothetical protein IPN76_19710 [Saprospiraceae bacterium]|nr:hypothetical protein [Saprospiraceae bacterium]
MVVLTDTGTYELIVNKAAPDTGELAWAFSIPSKPRQWTGALLKRETSQLLLGDLASEDTPHCAAG